MKKILCTTILTCALLTSAAHAAGDSSVIRTSQARLTELGYYTGPNDGKMGQLTVDALMDFQNQNGLPMTGTLTKETYRVLKQVDMARLHTGYAPYATAGYTGNAYAPDYYAANYTRNAYYANAAYGYNGVAPVPTPAPVTAWNNQYRTGVQAVPVRFGNLTVSEDRRAGVSNFSVAVNGQPVLLANNQPAPLRVSNTYHLNGEDAVIFTSYDGNAGCGYRNYLVTVRSDGTYAAPREVGNCSGAYQASINGGGLVISFPNGSYATGSNMWDIWHYNDNTLVHNS